MSGNAANPDIHGEPYRDESSPQIDLDARRSRERAALDIAVAALRDARRDLIVAVRASCELEPEEFSPENANVIRNIDRAFHKIACIIPEAVP